MERNTNQRRAIRKAFEETGRPLSPLEVLQAAKPYAPSLGIATVYRALKGLTEEGWLMPVELPGESPRFEMANKPHHHHFSCRKCKLVFDLPECRESFKALVPPNFTVDSHEVVFYGLCPKCGRR
ncbi:MAG: transcriptional repressor [Candidatus Sumerlaeaceae bacterium]|nr:transcriptional repressor [Candidatus Sumerlaeaceae bacterium]